MKIEAQFVCKDSRLCSLDGSEVSLEETVYISGDDFLSLPAEENKFYGIRIPFTEIGTDEDSYNEEFLASLRDALKVLEEKPAFAFIIPVCNETLTEETKSNFTASYKHCARRIKDCKNLIGFAIPPEADETTFVEELSRKHDHYVFFTDKDSSEFIKIHY